MLSARLARAGLRATAQQFSVPRTAALNGLRTYATPAKDVQPPVALFGVDGTYATALVRYLNWTLALLPFYPEVLKGENEVTKIPIPRNQQVMEKRKDKQIN